MTMVLALTLFFFNQLVEVVVIQAQLLARTWQPPRLLLPLI